jgi:hypothetical protein
MKRKFSMLLVLMVFLSVFLCCAPSWGLSVDLVYSVIYQGNVYDCPSTVPGTSSVWFSIPSIGMVPGDTFTLDKWPAGPYHFITGSERDSTVGPVTLPPNSCCISTTDAIGDRLEANVTFTIIHGAPAMNSIFFGIW